MYTKILWWQWFVSSESKQRYSSPIFFFFFACCTATFVSLKSKQRCSVLTYHTLAVVISKSRQSFTVSVIVHCGISQIKVKACEHPSVYDMSDYFIGYWWPHLQCILLWFSVTFLVHVCVCVNTDQKHTRGSKESFLIGQHNTKYAHFWGSPLFQSYVQQESKQSVYLSFASCMLGC